MMQINSFQYYLPVNLIFGPGKTEVLGEEAARYGKKVMAKYYASTSGEISQRETEH